MQFRPVTARRSLVQHILLLSSAALLSVSVALPVQAAEEIEVGITPPAVGAGPFQFDTAEQHDIRVDVLARGLAHGFTVAFLPNRDALLVERGVRLRLLRNATGPSPELVSAPIAGVPDFRNIEHAVPDDMLGLQDVALHPDFSKNQVVYYTYNRPAGFDATSGRLFVMTVLARARLLDMRLVEAKDIWVGEPVHGAGGSRILVTQEGMVYVGVGGLSRGDIDASQRTDNIYGKVLRVDADGKIPKDNPFAKVTGARGEIYTLGHRDVLGLAVDPRSGAIIASEHGPQGGDEINRILPGRNYGWPRFTYGTEYGGSPLPTKPLGPDTEPPLTIWTPGIAPSGIAFYGADKVPAWKNNLFIASARRGQINGTGALIRVVLNEKLQEMRQEILLDGLRQRFKDVRQGPDGLLYALTDESDSLLLRISPAPAGAH